jgi:sulfonate transport system permease protein
LGILCGRSNSFQSYCWPILEFLRHVPPLAAIPLIILWFGIDEGSKLVIIFLASFFPLFLNTYSGIKGCDRKLLEVGRSLHFTAWQQARLIQLPAALPAIAVGLQLSLGYSWRALIGAELIAASSGIGYMILDAEQMSRPDIVLVGLFAIGIVGSLIDWLFLALTNKILPWNTETGDKYAA